MELWDVLDVNGNPTGRIIERSGLLTAGEYYLGVHIYIINSKGEFLIQKRAKCKRHYPDIWDLNMGHVIAGETSKQAAIREISEEIGVRLEPDDLKLVERFVWEEYHHLIDVWLVNKDVDIRSAVLQQEEVSELKYVSKTELLGLLTETSESRPSRPHEYIERISRLK